MDDAYRNYLKEVDDSAATVARLVRETVSGVRQWMKEFTLGDFIVAKYSCPYGPSYLRLVIFQQGNDGKPTTLQHIVDGEGKFIGWHPTLLSHGILNM